MRKYKINITGRIVALVSGPWGGIGTIGGFVESEDNLSHGGECWIYDDARVSGNAYVFGDARVFGHAKVSDDAKVFDYARVFGHARVSGDAKVYGEAWVAAGRQTDDISTNPFFAIIEEMALT